MDTHDQPPASQLQHWIIAAAIVVAGVALALLLWRVFFSFTPPVQKVVVATKSTEKPSLTAEPVVNGYDHIWDLAFLPTKEIVFTERKGVVHLVQNGQVRDLIKIDDVFAQGEGGLLGLTVDPDFNTNRFIYTCFDSSKNGADKRDVRVARWKLNTELTALSDRTDIVTGMPVSTGRHSGCRVAFGPDGYLYVGTGDAAIGGLAINHKNLGGKILRVDRSGTAAPDNMGGDFDPRIFSYGHRNVQGIAFFPHPQNGVLGISVEHGSTVDDEVNLLTEGNFGWAAPTGPYTEINVPMTDKTAYPGAIDAIWSSGPSTIAPSGAGFLNGPQWKAWDGALAMAVLKGKHLKIMTISETNQVAATEDLFTDQYGRLRTAVQGPDGNLYISTDNGGTDQIIRVTPQ